MKYSSNEFFIEVLQLVPDNDSKSSFIIKEIKTESYEKHLEKTIKDYIDTSKILINKILGDNFKLNVDNSLFYCYLREAPIVRNYLQVKDLEPFNYEPLWRISILITTNYDKLVLPKIYLINKTKFNRELIDTKLDFSKLIGCSQKIYDSEITADGLMLTKVQLTHEPTVHENDSLDNENNENDNENNDENNEQYNNQVNRESEEDSEQSDNYPEMDDEREREEEEMERRKNNKNYIHIKGDITTEVVRDITNRLNLEKYMNADEEEGGDSTTKVGGANPIKLRSHNGNDKNNPNEGEGNRKMTPIIENFESSKESDCLYSDKEGKIIDYHDNNHENHKNNNNQDNNKEKEKEKEIDSVYLEDIRIVDLDVFIELMDLLCLYPSLKKFSLCDTPLEKDYTAWGSIIKLISENFNLRWIDLHKSNMCNTTLESLSKVLQNKRIRYLDLSENFISQEGAKQLSLFLNKNKTLQRLIINNNDLEDFKSVGVEYIARALALHPNIQNLDFSSMAVTGCGEQVGELIKCTKTLRVLILRDCTLNCKDFQFICRAMSSENVSKTIINVDMSYNDMAGDKSIEEMGKMIKANKNLTFLNLDKMNLTMDNYQYITDSLKENHTIVYVSFCFNPKVKPKIILEYFFNRKELLTFAYIPYKASINDKGPKVEFSFEEKKFIERFKKKRKKVKLITKEIVH